MRTVLILTLAYPPRISSCARRTGCMAKYLPQHGWRPVVLSKRWTQPGTPTDPNFVRGLPPETLVADVPDADAPGRLRRGWARVEGLARPHRFPPAWTRRARRLLPEIVSRYGVDAVWATCSPYATHYLADLCARAYGIPWVADFRDVLGQERGGLRERLRTRRLVPVEKQLVRSASAVTTVSDGLAALLEARHGRTAHVLHNGFDPEDYAGDGARASEKFVIGYFGAVHSHRDPRPVFAALDRLADGPDVCLDDLRVVFYGPRPQRVAALASGFRCARLIECHGLVGHAEMVRLMSRASVLLVLACAAGQGVLTGKLFEYLGARRPILAVPSDGDGIDALLDETQAGVSCSSVDEIAERLLAWYREWRTSGRLECRAREAAIGKYSRRRQAGKLAELLDHVAAPEPTPRPSAPVGLAAERLAEARP